MHTTDHPKFTTLWYRSVACQALDCALALPNLADDYYPVVSWPSIEIGDDHEDIADVLVARTLAPDWALACRRRITPGDVFTYGSHIYMYTNRNTAQQFSMTGRRAFRLRRWLQLWIIEFEQEPEPCKVST